MFLQKFKYTTYPRPRLDFFSHRKRLFSNSNIEEHQKRLADAAERLFKSAGFSVRRFTTGIQTTTHRLYPLLLSEASHTSRWNSSDAKLFGFPDSWTDVATESPSWLTKPLNQIVLDEATQKYALLEGINLPRKHTGAELGLTLDLLNDYSDKHGILSSFPNTLTRSLISGSKAESAVVPLASDLLRLSGFLSKSWMCTGLPGIENKIEVSMMIGTQKLVITSIPDFILWKKDSLISMNPVGTAFCEVKRKGVFMWPQLVGELLALAEFRRMSNKTNPDGSTDSFSICVSGTNVKIISASFPPNFWDQIQNNEKSVPVVECWPKIPKDLLVERDRREIFQALICFREYIEERNIERED